MDYSLLGKTISNLVLRFILSCLVGVYKKLIEVNSESQIENSTQYYDENEEFGNTRIQVEFDT